MISLITVLSIAIAISMLIASPFVLKDSFRKRDFLLYITIYPFLATTWIVRSVYNFTFAKGTSWR
jgi:hypothetical protein